MSPQPSAFIRLIVLWILPLSMVLALTQIMYGHDQPGDGFTAGVIVSLAVGSWYVVFGYDDTKQRLAWLRPVPLIALGLLLFIGNGVLAAVLYGNVFSHVEYDTLVGLPLPPGFHISSAFLTEVAICLTVLGSAVFMLDALGHPGDPVTDD